MNFIYYHLSFVVAEERENKAWTEWIALDRQRKINRREKRERERERADTDDDIIFLVFCCCNRIWVLFVPFLHLRGGWGPRRRIHLGAVIFGSSLHYRVLYPTNFLFLFSIPHPPQQFSTGSFQPISASGQFVADTFLF